jgi:hypothetical protein
MSTLQESLACIHDPAILRLLRSSLPAYLACPEVDGARRIVTAPFHWDGTELVLCPPPNASKMPVFPDGAETSVSIDSDAPPWTVLLIRGVACSALSASMDPVVRVRPMWIGMLDFRASVAGDGQCPRSQP